MERKTAFVKAVEAGCSLFSCAADFHMCRLIAVLSAAAAFGLAMPAFAEHATLEAILFSSVSVARMAPQMDRSEYLFDAKWCALLVKNAAKSVKPEK